MYRPPSEPENYTYLVQKYIQPIRAFHPAICSWIGFAVPNRLLFTLPTQHCLLVILVSDYTRLIRRRLVGLLRDRVKEEVLEDNDEEEEDGDLAEYETLGERGLQREQVGVRHAWR